MPATAILLLACSPALAQDVFESEDLRSHDESSFKAKYRLTNYFDAPVRSQNAQLGFVQEEAK